MLLFMTFALLLAVPALALADTLTVSNTLITNTNATKAPGDTGTANVWLETTNGTPAGDTNGCNASTNTGQGVTVTLSSNNSAVTFPSGNTATITDCGSDKAKQIAYKVADNAAAGSAVISAAATGGKTDGTRLYNTSDNLTVTITAPADSTLPDTSITDGPAAGSWIKQNSATFTFTGSDNVTSAANLKYQYQLDSGGWSTAATSTTATLTSLSQGSHTFEVRAVDAAGNVDDTPASRSFSVDTIAPSVDCGSADGNWHADNVSIGCTASDGGSGLADSGDGSFNLSTSVADGNETNNASTNSRTVFDVAGNSTQAGPIAANKVDRKAPTVLPGDVTNTTWRNSSLSEDFTSSDGGSGLALNQGLGTNGSFTLTASAESADANTPTVVSKAVKDAVGNTTTRSVSALIDLTNPSVSAQLNKTAAATGWFNTSTGAPTVSFLCSDALSGLAGTCPSPYTFGEGANQSRSSGNIFDNAGNSNSAGVQNVNVDLSDPTNIQFVGGPAAGESYDFGNVPAPAPTCTADDTGGSGLKDCAVTGYSTAAGTHTMTAKATDNAGNSATATRTYTVARYRLSGFYQPVDMNDTVNTVKNGSTVPVKFELFQSISGTELTSTSAVSSVLARPINCAAFTGDPEDPIEMVTTGGTSLRYDATAGQFIYNWQTPKGASQVGKCYSLTMTAADSSTITAYFKLK
jgi:hypothetical protein